jgi:phage N-6-adenine-methyltransferase
MSELALPRRNGKVTPFAPRNFKFEQLDANAVIDKIARLEAAAKTNGEVLNDWPALEEATAAKVDGIIEFCRWWNEAVRANHRPETNADRNYLSTARAEELSGIRQPQVSRWRKRLGWVKDEDGFVECTKREAFELKIIAAARKKAELALTHAHRAQGTGENEWFTPVQYIEAARQVMGGIDLDPATHPAAQETIKADNFFTRLDDGLKQEWYGRVWLNPPYSQPEIGEFSKKMVDEVRAGRVSEGIMLTHNYTDTAWFHLLQSQASMICFTRGRIKFVDVSGDDCAPTQGQAFSYFGDNIEGFAEEFADHGFLQPTMFGLKHAAVDWKRFASTWS